MLRICRILIDILKAILAYFFLIYQKNKENGWDLLFRKFHSDWMQISFEMNQAVNFPTVPLTFNPGGTMTGQGISLSTVHEIHDLK